MLISFGEFVGAKTKERFGGAASFPNDASHVLRRIEEVSYRTAKLLRRTLKARKGVFR